MNRDDWKQVPLGTMLVATKYHGPNDKMETVEEGEIFHLSQFDFGGGMSFSWIALEEKSGWWNPEHFEPITIFKVADKALGALA